MRWKSFRFHCIEEFSSQTRNKSFYDRFVFLLIFNSLLISAECNCISHATHTVIQGWEFNSIKRRFALGFVGYWVQPTQIQHDRRQISTHRAAVMNEDWTEKRLWSTTKVKESPIERHCAIIIINDGASGKPHGKTLGKWKREEEISLSWFYWQRKLARKMFNKLKSRRSFRSFDKRLHHIGEHLFQ